MVSRVFEMSCTNYPPLAFPFGAGTGFSFGAGFAFVAAFSLGAAFVVVVSLGAAFAAVVFLGAALVATVSLGVAFVAAFALGAAFGTGCSLGSTFAFFRLALVGFSSAMSWAFRFDATLLAAGNATQSVRPQVVHHQLLHAYLSW